MVRPTMNWRNCSQLNQKYRDQFGFPFIICAREHTKEEIPDAIEARLANSRAQEIDNSLARNL